ncbi:MAG: phasin family protein [Alphaproteobacteria bacterium]|nr:phasin family protein [Alphaproteobacteria bacterium]
MAHNNPFSTFFTNDKIQETLEKYQSSTLDFGAFLEANRKNLQTLAKAQQIGLQNAQALTNKQMEIVAQFIQDQTNATNDILCEGKTEVIQSSYKKAMSNFEDISKIIKDANKKTSRLLKEQSEDSQETVSPETDNKASA